MQHRRFLISLIAAAAAAFAFVWVITSNSEQTPTSGLRTLAPDFALKDLTDRTVRLSDFVGKIRIVNFWATWCPPCRKEIPHFQALTTKYGDRGVVIIGISVDQEELSTVQTFVESMKISYPILIADPAVIRAYGSVASIPTTFLIDRKGQIFRKYVGYRDQVVFEKDIRALLTEG